MSNDSFNKDYMINNNYLTFYKVMYQLFLINLQLRLIPRVYVTLVIYHDSSRGSG